jgi:shikimate dehydrogenase
MKIFGIIGSPITHSLSPKMHEAAYRKLKLSCSYKSYDVSAEKLGAFIADGRKRFAGLNVTVPHKVAVIEYLDELDESAKLIGAVNTIKFVGGKAKGYNTDGVGCAKALEAANIQVRGRKVLVLGAGGAARAIVYQLVEEGADVVIANRTRENAEKLAAEVREKTGKEVGVVELSSVGGVIPEVDVVVNTTTVGMTPKKGESPLPADVLSPRLVVMDIVYNPVETRLLRDAKKRGCKTVDGVGMLVHQGAESFKIWLGIDAPIEEMRDAVMKELGGKHGG